MRRWKPIQSLELRWRLWKLHVDDFFFGAAMSWVMMPHTLRQRQELERIFALESGSRLLGLPLLPGVYRLKLLPYLVPNLLYWRRLTIFDRELEGADLKHLGH